MRIGLSQWPPYEMPFLARDLGYLDGVPVELVDMRTPAEVRRAYRNGLLDGVAVTTQYAVEFAAWEGDDRIGLVIDVSDGADALVARRDIDTVADLRGKRIGLENTTLGPMIALRALEKYGVARDEVTFVPIDFPDQRAAFESGAVDAMVTYEPVRSQLLNLGGKVLFSSHEMPNEVVDVLVVHGKAIDSRLSDLRRLTDGWFRAVDYVAAHPDDAARRMAPREDLEPAQVQSALQGVRLLDRSENLALLSGPHPVLLRGLERTTAAMHTLDLMDVEPDFSELVTDQVVRAP